LNPSGKAVVDLADALDTELERERKKRTGKAVLVLSSYETLLSVQVKVGERRKRWGSYAFKVFGSAAVIHDRRSRIAR
jgi:hypothetical protein